MRPWHLSWVRVATVTVLVLGLVGAGGCKPTDKTKKGGKSGASSVKAGSKDSSEETAKQPGGAKRGGKGGGKGGARGGKDARGANGGQGAGRERGAGGGKRSAEKGGEPVVLPPLEGIEFTVPQDWKARASAKTDENLRLSFDLPKTGKEPGKATVLVYHQPTIKGQESEEIKKWYANMKPAGGEGKVDPVLTKSDVESGIEVLIADVSGAIESKRNKQAENGEVVYRIISAVINDPQGPHTVKVMGPKAEVDANSEAIMAFIKSVKSKA